MKAIFVVCLLVFLAHARRLGESTEETGPAPLRRGLKKPIIMDPLSTPAVMENLKKIAEVLGKEPEVAGEVGGSEESADSIGEDDAALMGPDKCDMELPSEQCKKKAHESGNIEQQAESTLEEHAQLEGKIGEHIKKLEEKLALLKKKHAELAKTDQKLKKEMK